MLLLRWSGLLGRFGRFEGEEVGVLRSISFRVTQQRDARTGAVANHKRFSRALVGGGSTL